MMQFKAKNKKDAIAQYREQYFKTFMSMCDLSDSTLYKLCKDL